MSLFIMNDENLDVTFYADVTIYLLYINNFRIVVLM